MADKRRGLGRGLGALIPPVTEAVSDNQRPVDVFFPHQDGASNAAEKSDSASTQPTGVVDPAAKMADAQASAKTGAKPAGAKTGGGKIAGTKTPAKSKRKAKKETVPAAPQTAAPEQAAVQTGAHPAAKTSVGAVAPAGGASADASASPATAHDVARTTPTPQPEQTAAGVPPKVQEHLPEGDVSDTTLVPVPGVSFAELPVGAIRPNSRQPRQVFDEEAMLELVQSIQQVGVLQPVVVRPLAAADICADGVQYELIMGERRWRATQRAGLAVVPAIVRHTKDSDLLRDALLENLHRSQLNPLEEAAAYEQLLADFACTHDELASRIGRSRPQISNMVRLLRLPPSVQALVAEGTLSAGHARALLGLTKATDMEQIAEKVVEQGLSVRATEHLVAVAEQGNTGQSSRRRPPQNAELTSRASRLSSTFDTRVGITMGKKKGKVTIEFTGIEDLDRIMEMLVKNKR